MGIDDECRLGDDGWRLRRNHRGAVVLSRCGAEELYPHDQVDKYGTPAWVKVARRAEVLALLSDPRVRDFVRVGKLHERQERVWDDASGGELEAA
jgi:hypothetical protein